MSIVWKANGTPFATLGLVGLRRERTNMGEDVCTFVADGAKFDATTFKDGTTFFAYGSTVTITRTVDSDPAVKFFVGRCMAPERFGEPGAEQVLFTLAGPWWYFENLVFQQYWKFPVDTADPDSALANANQSLLLLNLAEDGSKLTTEQQVTAVVNFAIAAGAPIALGTGFPTLDLPIDEMTDASCAEVIRKMFRWTPDRVLWWDYTASSPTLNCAARGTATALTLGLSDVAAPESLRLRARNDLQKSAVVLKYSYNEQVDELTWPKLEVDKYPVLATEIAFDTLVMTIPLAGGSSTVQTQKIKTRSISENSDTWWKKHLPWMADATISSLSISDGAKDPTGFPNEIVEGQTPEWKETSSKLVTVTAKATYTHTTAAGAIVQKKDEPISVVVMGTTLSSPSESSAATYARTVSSIAAEPVPTGLAQAVYESLSTLHYEGVLTTLATEVGADDSTGPRPGKVLNLSFGLAAWSTMNALIQTVVEDVDSGRVELRVGPPQHLGPQDMVELLRVNRGRTLTWMTSQRTAAQARSQGLNKGSTSNGDHNASSAGGGITRLKLVDGTDATKIADINPADLPTGKTAAFRAFAYCPSEGATPQTIYILATVPA